jgi:hypothetical protein
MSSILRELAGKATTFHWLDLDALINRFHSIFFCPTQGNGSTSTEMSEFWKSTIHWKSRWTNSVKKIGWFVIWIIWKSDWNDFLWLLCSTILSNHISMDFILIICILINEIHSREWKKEKWRIVENGGFQYCEYDNRDICTNISAGFEHSSTYKGNLYGKRTCKQDLILCFSESLSGSHNARKSLHAQNREVKNNFFADGFNHFEMIFVRAFLIGFLVNRRIHIEILRNPIPRNLILLIYCRSSRPINCENSI